MLKLLNSRTTEFLFKGKSRCSSVKIVKKAGVKRVAIDLFARVFKEKFSSVDEISQRYLAFEN